MKRETYYAVKLRHELANGHHNGPAIYYWKRDAIAHRNRILPHLVYKPKIVRVVLEAEE